MAKRQKSSSGAGAKKSAAPPAFASIDLGDGRPKHRFNSFAELEEWVESEVNAWKWISGTIMHSRLRQVLSGGLSPASQIGTWQNHIQRVRNGQDDEKSAADQITRQVSDAVKSGNVVLSEMPEGKFVLALKDKSPLGACAAYAYLTGIAIRLDQWNGDLGIDVLDGLLGAALFQHGSGERDRAEAARMAEVRENAEVLIADIASKKREAGLEWDKWMGAGNTRARRILTGALKRRSHFRRRGKELFMDAERRLGDLEELYRTKMALKAPVAYWTDKLNGHKKGFKWWSRALLSVTFLGGCALVGLWAWLLNAPLVESEVVGQPGFQDLRLWQIGAALLGATVFLVLLRLCMRHVLSESHLANDANERVVMVETLLALSDGGHAGVNENLQLILAALFRPTATGLVKDDGVPAALHEAIIAKAAGS